jgi:hypothetical protein
MSAPIDDGGPAFPVHSTHAMFNGKVVAIHEQGMSLRDWFAGQAFAGLLANRDLLEGILKQSKKLGLTHDEGAAKAAYEYADAMLAARKETK